MSIPAPTELGAGLPPTRGYQQEMLEESLNNNLIIALDTGSGKTHIAVLRMKFAAENEAKKVKHIFTVNDIPNNIRRSPGSLRPLWRYANSKAQ